jgi:hypothetical protein
MITIFRPTWDANAEQWQSIEAEDAALTLRAQGFDVEILEEEGRVGVECDHDDELEAIGALA